MGDGDGDDGYVVRIRGLPWSASVDEVSDFLEGITFISSISFCHIPYFFHFRAIIWLCLTWLDNSLIASNTFLLRVTKKKKVGGGGSKKPIKLRM